MRVMRFDRSQELLREIGRVHIAGSAYASALPTKQVERVLTSPAPSKAACDELCW